jgi:hypothetical protein
MIRRRFMPCTHCNKPAHQELYKRHVIKIWPDDSAENPEEWENDTILLVSYHRRYGKNHGFETPEVATAHAEKNGMDVFVVYGYEHSGLALSLERTGQFADRWDSGTYGLLLVSKEQYTDTKKSAECFIETYNQYLGGEVYGFVVETPGGKEKDSCWGFYGMDSVIDEAKGQVDYYFKKKKKQEAV